MWESQKQIIVLILSFILSICFSYLNLSTTPFSPTFLLTELGKQWSYIFLTVQIIGLIQLLTIPESLELIPLSTIPKSLEPSSYKSILIPVSILAYSLTVSMVYAQTSYCSSPKRKLAFTQALKPVLAIVVMFFTLVRFNWFKQGFYEIFNSGQYSPSGYWTAVSFWLACAILPFVSHVYFIAIQQACNPNTAIK